MSTDNDTKIINELIQTLEDGKDGYAAGAEKLADSDSPELVELFTRYSVQRHRFADDLRGLLTTGVEADTAGTITGALHRGWMAIRDAVTGDSPDAVLKVAQQGEEHAISEYEKALEGDISSRLRTVVETQLVEIREARTRITSHVAA